MSNPLFPGECIIPMIIYHAAVYNSDDLLLVTIYLTLCTCIDDDF